MGYTNTRKMVQGAMIAALFGALSLINTYTGSMFDIFICYGMVVPIVWYGYQYDIKSNFIVCFVSMIVIALMGLPFFIISALSSCFAGVFIAEALKRKAKKETLLLGVFIVTFCNNIFIYEVFSGILGIDLISETKVMYQEMVHLVPSLSQTISVDMFLSLIPLVLIIMSAMEMYVIVLLCQIILTRLKIEFPGSFHIASMHLSKKAGKILAGIWLLAYILNQYVKLDVIYLNYVQILGSLIFSLQGLSFISFYLIVKQKAKWMIVVLILFLFPMFHIVYVVLGILDIFSDLRRNILYNKTDNDKEG